MDVAFVVSEIQHSFVKGCQILDATLKANEAINSSLKSSRGGVVHKLDIQKANNHVIWP